MEFLGQFFIDNQLIKSECQHDGHQQLLGLVVSVLSGRKYFLKQDSLMCHMLVNNPETVIPGCRNKTLMQLAQQSKITQVNQGIRLAVNKRQAAVAVISASMCWISTSVKSCRLVDPGGLATGGAEVIYSVAPDNPSPPEAAFGHCRIPPSLHFEDFCDAPLHPPAITSAGAWNRPSLTVDPD